MSLQRSCPWKWPETNFSIQEKILRILIPRYLACSELALLLALVKTKALTATFKHLSCCSCLARGPVWYIHGEWQFSWLGWVSCQPSPSGCEHPGSAVSPGKGSLPEQQTRSTWDVLGATEGGTNALMKCAAPQGVFSGERRDSASAGHSVQHQHPLWALGSGSHWTS